MKITLYPKLRDALETLGENEYLYTHSWLPLVIVYKYEKKSDKYKPTSVVEPRASSRYDRYEHFFFRKEVIGDIIESLISLAEKNDEVFKAPLKEIVTLGLKELEIKDKGFICVGNVESYYQLYYRNYKKRRPERDIDKLNEPILMSIKDEGWKERFLGFGIPEEKVKEELEKRIPEVLGIKSGNHHTWGKYRWIDILIVSDKEIKKGKGGKGRALARFWEDEGILGVDKIVNRLLSDWSSESESELKSLLEDSIEKFDPNSLTKIMLGGISVRLLGLPEPKEMEVILVPFRISDKNEGEYKEVEFLALMKQEIKDRVFLWGPISVTHSEYTNELVVDPIRNVEQVRIVSREEIPIEVSKERGKTIFIDTKLTEQVTVSNRAGNLVKEIKYNSNLEDSKYVVAGVEDLETPSIKEYKEVEKTKVVDEKIVIKTLQRGEIKNSRCEDEDELIKKEVEDLLEEIYEHERKNQEQGKRSGIRVAGIVVKRLLEVLEDKERIRGRECGQDISSVFNDFYYHTIYPKKTSEHHESFIEATKDLSTPKIAKRAKRTVELLEKEKERKLCFKVDGVEKKIDTHKEMEEILKDPYKLYIKILSESLSKKLNNVISNVKGVPKELKENNRLSVTLSGIVASVVGKFPVDDKIDYMTDSMYELIFRSMSGEEFEHYYDVEDKNFGWRKIKDTSLIWKNIIRDVVGLRLEISMTEEIDIIVPKKGEGEMKVWRNLHISAGMDHNERPWTVYLDSGYKDKLIEIKVWTTGASIRL